MPVREIPKNYSNLTGKVHTLSCSAHVGFESSLEKDFVILFDFDCAVDYVEEQPVSIPYRTLQSRQGGYTPDFLVTYRSDDGVIAKRQPELYEVKYREDLFANWEILKPKFKAARRYAKARGWRFRIITEKEIKSPMLENARFLKSYRNRDNPEHITRKFLAILQSLKATTFQSLLEMSFPDKWERAQAIPVLWKLVAIRDIGTDLTKPLSMKSPIWCIREWYDCEK